MPSRWYGFYPILTRYIADTSATGNNSWSPRSWLLSYWGAHLLFDRISEDSKLGVDKIVEYAEGVFNLWHKV